MNNGKRTSWLTLIPYLVVVIAIFSLFNMSNGSTSAVVSYTTMKNIVESEKVEDVSVSIGSNVISVAGVYTDDNGSAISFTSNMPNSSDQ